MKILSIGNFGTGWDGSICDEENIACALEGLGHKVFRVQREKTLPGGGSFAIGYGADRDAIDFILIAQWDGYDGDFLRELKEYFENTLIVYWAFDHQDQSQEWHQRLVQQSDLYLSKRIVDAIYPNWQWLSQDFAPDFLEQHPDRIEKDIDVLFTGSYLPWAEERNETLKAVDEKFNLHIYGVTPAEWKSRGFKNVHGPVMDYKLPELIERAKVNLSIDHTLERGYWSDRNSQIMSCGGFVLCRYAPMMESIFRSNVAYFYDKENCVDQIEYWLEHDEDREVIAAEAYDNSAYYKARERVADMLNIVRSIL